MAEDKKKQASKSKASAEKKSAVKNDVTAKKIATAKKETVSKKDAAAKKTTAKKTTEGAKKEAEAKKTTTKKTTTAKKEVAAKKTAGEVKKDTSVKKSKEAHVKKETKVENKSKKEDEKINLNKTTFVKAGNTSKKWIILDAAGKPLGRVAALAASMLRGKHKVDFTPNVDCGDSVIIINCKDVVLTGKKLEQKVRYHHSGWIGGIKETRYSELMKKEPQKAMTMAVEGMLPHNSLGARMARHLRTYKDDKHGHEAQKPEVFEFKV